MRHAVSFIIVLAAIALFGCTRQYAEPKMLAPEAGQIWEHVWVDPSLLHSDSVSALMTFTRMDSVLLVDEPAVDPPASIAFSVTNQVCPVQVDLLSSNLSLMTTLFVDRLPPDNYRFVFYQDRFKLLPLPPGRYLLRATICDREKLSPFIQYQLPSVQ